MKIVTSVMEDPIKDVGWKIKSIIGKMWLYSQLSEHLCDGYLSDGMESTDPEGLVGGKEFQEEGMAVAMG